MTGVLSPLYTASRGLRTTFILGLHVYRPELESMESTRPPIIVKRDADIGWACITKEEPLMKLSFITTLELVMGTERSH